MTKSKQLSNAIESLKAEHEKELKRAFYNYILAKFEEGEELNVSECAILLNMKEMTIRAYANPKRKILTTIKKEGKTHITNQSIKLFINKKPL